MTKLRKDPLDSQKDFLLKAYEQRDKVSKPTKTIPFENDLWQLLDEWKVILRQQGNSELDIDNIITIGLVKAIVELKEGWKYE